MPTSSPEQTLPAWPSKKLESFKYTDLSALAQLGKPAASAQLAVTVQPGLSLTQQKGPLTGLPSTPVVARALAQTDSAWHLHAGTAVAEPVTLAFTHTPGSAVAPQCHIHVARGASLTVLEDASGATASFANRLCTIVLEDGAQLTHLRRQSADADSINLATTAVSLGRDARYLHVNVTTGAALSRHELHIALTAPGSEATVTGLHLLSGSQHADLTLNMRHLSPHCRSTQLVRSVLSGAAAGVFQGRIEVAPDAQKTDARQQSRALLLSPTAEMNSKPELEIYANDVVCAHGAAIGQLDANALFYLKSRGIPDIAARRLLVDGFIREALEGLPEGAARLFLEIVVNDWLDRAA